MHKDSLKQQIIKLAEVSEEEAEKFCNLFEYKKVAKKQLVLERGGVCNFEAYVIKGLFKVYHIDYSGMEQILYFAAEDWWLANIDSFNNNSPSELYIQAIEDSEILVISKKDKLFALQNIPFVEKLFRIMTQNAYVSLQRRMVENLSVTADERYLNFIEEYSEIAQRLTNVQVAAYLGITHEFVSRIRKKITQKD
nr:Crp/Fnr family transcriptional regulator [uncultured Chryseobacterium sp.]